MQDIAQACYLDEVIFGKKEQRLEISTFIE